MAGVSLVTSISTNHSDWNILWILCNAQDRMEKLNVLSEVINILSNVDSFIII